MIQNINKKRYYDAFLINSKLNRTKTAFEYELDKLHLEKIIAVLNQAKHTMLQPRVAHLAIFINEDFDCKALTARLKRVYGSDKVLFAYSIEKADKLHIHLMLVLETKDKDINPATVFMHSVVPTIKAMKNVEGCQLNPRLDWYDNITAKYTHDLKIDSEFRDAINRFSYLSKKNDKKNIDTVYKKFATSQIKNNKYYSLIGHDNMLKIKQIHKNEKLTFNNNAALNKRYFNFRKTVNVVGETKSMYHFIDTTTNEAIGFYGYSYSAAIYPTHYILNISIDDLYIEPSYAQAKNNSSSTFDALYFHLRDEMNRILSGVKNELQDGQELVINSIAYDNTALEETLKAVVSLTAIEQSLTISQLKG